MHPSACATEFRFNSDSKGDTVAQQNAKTHDYYKYNFKIKIITEVTGRNLMLVDSTSLADQNKNLDSIW